MDGRERDEPFLKMASSRWLLTLNEVDECRRVSHNTDRTAAEAALFLKFMDPYEIDVILKLVEKSCAIVAAEVAKG